ncbi:MAG TPA: hypothetical protein ENF68_00775 [bacterium]|nr:hypothetical protein [bacterium]
MPHPEKFEPRPEKERPEPEREEKGKTFKEGKIEKWIEIQKENLKEQTRAIYSEIYGKVFPERDFHIDFQVFPEGHFIKREKEGETISHLLNEEVFKEKLKKRLRKEGPVSDKELAEIAERWIVTLAAHEARHDVFAEKMEHISFEELDRLRKDFLNGKGIDEKAAREHGIITYETLSGCEEMQEMYKDLMKSLLEERKISSLRIPEECDAEIIERVIERLAKKGIKDTDLISEIVRYGDGPKIARISNLLKERQLDSPELLEKIKGFIKERK